MSANSRRYSLDVGKSDGDPPLGDLILAFETLGVDAQQVLSAVASPFGDLCWGYSPVEPSREARVAQVVRAPHKRGPSGPLPCVTTRLHDGFGSGLVSGLARLAGSYRFWRRYNRAALRPADATMIRPRM
jgi:hypothetical protein